MFSHCHYDGHKDTDHITAPQRPGKDKVFLISCRLEERVICFFTIFSGQSMLPTIIPQLTRKWRKQAN